MKVYVTLYDSTKYEVYINKELVYVKDIIIKLLSDHPELKNKKGYDIDYLNAYHNTILIKNKILSLNSVVRDGDEIIILPLISGG